MSPHPFHKATTALGRLLIRSSRNNTLLTLTDPQGRVLLQSSGGSVGFRHSRKATPYAAQRAMEDLIGRALQRGLRRVEVRLSGLGPGKESSLRVLAKSPLQVVQLQECTPLPHNGCRPPARRRL
jgi:small subunit ribosomal protein S11